MHLPKSLGKVMENYQGGDVGQIFVWFDGQIVKICNIKQNWTRRAHKKVELGPHEFQFPQI